MNQPKQMLLGVVFPWLAALVNCSTQPTPPAGAPTASANAIANAPPASSASALPSLTASGVVSSGPLPPAAPSSSTAAAAPASSGSAAPAAKMCGGFAGFQCPEKQFCAYPLSAKCGAGDMSGTCQPIPELCTMEFSPVCGCDGKTYSTACVAARSGVSVAKAGACAGDSGSGIAEGKTCGTRGVHGDCSEGLYCAYRSQCGSTDSGGTCSKKPQTCTREYMPVCGCDNRTYPNKCEAARAGASVATTGECKPSNPSTPK